MPSNLVKCFHKGRCASVWAGCVGEWVGGWVVAWVGGWVDGWKGGLYKSSINWKKRENKELWIPIGK